jgi:tetratricopeptide (TPR) repeat protein
MIGLIYNSGYKNHKMDESYIYKAIDAAKAADDGAFIVNGYNNLGVNQETQNNIEEAIDASKKAIAAIKKYDVKKYMVKHLYNNIANSYLKIEKYDLAKQALDSAFIAYNTIGEVNKTLQSSRFFRGYYLWNRNYYKGIGNMDEAYKYALLSDSLRIISSRKSLRTIKRMTSDEVKLKDELLISNKEKLKNRNIVLLLSILLLLTVGLFFYKTFKLSLKLSSTLKDKEVLNDKLKEKLLEIEEKNKDLIDGKTKIEALLKLNDQALFSKTLKLSNYKDAVQGVINNVEKLVDSNTKLDVSKLFFINKSLKQILSEEEIWEDFKVQFEKNRPDFFKKLLERNPSLSIIEQKHCAYVAINLKSKEVANILNLSPRSIETARYRIKKKLELKDKNLSSFLKEL